MTNVRNSYLADLTLIDVPVSEDNDEKSTDRIFGGKKRSLDVPNDRNAPDFDRGLVDDIVEPVVEVAKENKVFEGPQHSLIVALAPKAWSRKL